MKVIVNRNQKDDSRYLIVQVLNLCNFVDIYHFKYYQVLRCVETIKAEWLNWSGHYDSK